MPRLHRHDCLRRRARELDQLRRAAREELPQPLEHQGAPEMHPPVVVADLVLVRLRDDDGTFERLRGDHRHLREPGEQARGSSEVGGQPVEPA